MNVILAIDPGYDRCGVAIVSVELGKPVLSHSECITTKKTDAQEIRLATIYKAIEHIIVEWRPSHLALETLFFSVNKKTAMKVAESRGVIMLLAGIHNLSLIELSPQEVKLSITGSGNADKAAVQKMVGLTLKLDVKKKIDDEVDAIALGFASVGYIGKKY